jgi:hypothetical protein
VGWPTDGLAIRDALAWSPRARLPGPSTLDGLSPAALSRVTALAERYDLAPLLAACGRVERDESLYVLDLLDRWAPPTEGRCLDVGSKNGAYVPGLATWAPGRWDAVERDAHRRYLDGRTRRARGEAMAAAFPGCRFIAGDVRDQRGPYARITWLLPFVLPAPHRAWGLPVRLFDPAALLAHVQSLLTTDGVLLIVNQGEEEAEEQARLLAGAPFEALGRVESALSPFRLPRYAFRAPR